MADPLPSMRGFPAAVAHAPPARADDQVGRFAIGLDGIGADRRLVMLVRHADGTGLTVSLSDLGMGRFGDLIFNTYGTDDPRPPAVSLERPR